VLTARFRTALQDCEYGMKLRCDRYCIYPAVSHAPGQDRDGLPGRQAPRR